MSVTWMLRRARVFRSLAENLMPSATESDVGTGSITPLVEDVETPPSNHPDAVFVCALEYKDWHHG